MPRGSIFSMLQTVTQLSKPSLTTSYSTSFQPFRLLSIKTWTERRIKKTKDNEKLVFFLKFSWHKKSFGKPDLPQKSKICLVWMIECSGRDCRQFLVIGSETRAKSTQGKCSSDKDWIAQLKISLKKCSGKVQTSWAACSAPCSVLAALLGATSSPIALIKSLNFSRSSVFMIAVIGVPRT